LLVEIMIIRNFLNLLKVKKKEFVYMSIVIWFLIFLLNIMIFVYLWFSTLSENVRKKLGFYFYIKSESIVVSGEKQRPISLAIKFMNELKSKWIEVEYISKEDALKLFQKNFPELVETFKRYSIKNPLPDALFVVVKNEKEYQILKQLYNKYKNILYDIQWIDKQESFSKQKQIVKKTLDFLNFMRIFLIFLTVFVIIVVISILILIIKLDFYAFVKQIEVEKLLWSFYWQIELPFVMKVILLLLVSFLLNIGVFYILGNKLFVILNQIGLNLVDFLSNNKPILTRVLLIEILGIFSISIVVSIWFLWRLIRRV